MITIKSQECSLHLWARFCQPYSSTEKNFEIPESEQFIELSSLSRPIEYLLEFGDRNNAVKKAACPWFAFQFSFFFKFAVQISRATFNSRIRTRFAFIIAKYFQQIKADLNPRKNNKVFENTKKNNLWTLYRLTGYIHLRSTYLQSLFQVYKEPSALL